MEEEDRREKDNICGKPAGRALCATECDRTTRTPVGRLVLALTHRKYHTCVNVCVWYVYAQVYEFVDWIVYILCLCV